MADTGVNKILQKMDTKNLDYHVEADELKDFIFGKDKKENLNELGGFLRDNIFQNDLLVSELRYILENDFTETFEEIKGKIAENRELNSDEKALIFINGMINCPVVGLIDLRQLHKQYEFDSSKPIKQIFNGGFLGYIQGQYNNYSYDPNKGKEDSRPTVENVKKKGKEGGYRNPNIPNPIPEEIDEEEKVENEYKGLPQIPLIRGKEYVHEYCNKIIKWAEDNGYLMEAERESMERNEFRSHIEYDETGEGKVVYDKDYEAYVKYDKLLYAFGKYCEVINKKHEELVKKAGYWDLDEFAEEMQYIDGMQEYLKSKYPDLDEAMERVNPYLKEMEENRNKYFRGKTEAEVEKAGKKFEEYKKYEEKKIEEYGITEETIKSLCDTPKDEKELEIYLKNLNAYIGYQYDVEGKKREYGEDIDKYLGYIKGIQAIREKYGETGLDSDLEMIKGYMDELNSAGKMYKPKGQEVGRVPGALTIFDKFNKYSELISADPELSKDLKNMKTINEVLSDPTSEDFWIEEVKKEKTEEKKRQEKRDRKWNNWYENYPVWYELLSTGASIWNTFINFTVGTGTSLGAMICGLILGKEHYQSSLERKERWDSSLTIGVTKEQQEGIYDSETGEITLNWKNGPYMVASSVTNMYLLILGGDGAGKGVSKIFSNIGRDAVGKAGLFSMSFITQAGQSYTEAMNAGLEGNGAFIYSMLTATAQSSLELVSPNEVLLGKGTGVGKEMVRALCKDGNKGGIKLAGKYFLKTMFREMGEEILQEEMQLAAGNLINDFYNGTWNTNFESDWGYKNFLATAMITAMTTGIATGISSGGTTMQIMRGKNKPLIEKIFTTEGLYEDVMKVLENAIKGEQKIPDVKIEQLEVLKTILTNIKGNLEENQAETQTNEMERQETAQNKFKIKVDINTPESIEKIKNSFLFYENEILPLILSNPKVTQQKEGYHGLFTHTRNVVFRGICYAISLGKDPIPVVFACACHDLARTNEAYDEEHGKNAVPITEEIINNNKFNLTEEQKSQIIDAVENHTTGEQAPNYISACLRDADRTRLSRDYKYEEKFYNTEQGKKIGSGSREDFLKFQTKCIGSENDISGNNDFIQCEDPQQIPTNDIPGKYKFEFTDPQEIPYDENSNLHRIHEHYISHGRCIVDGTEKERINNLKLDFEKLEGIRKLGVEFSEENIEKLNEVEYDFGKLGKLKELGIEINEKNIIELNEVEYDFEKLGKLKELGIRVDKNNIIELNEIEYNFEKLGKLKGLGIEINEKNIIELNKIVFDSKKSLNLKELCINHSRIIFEINEEIRDKLIKEVNLPIDFIKNNLERFNNESIEWLLNNKIQDMEWLSNDKIENIDEDISISKFEFLVDRGIHFPKSLITPNLINKLFDTRDTFKSRILIENFSKYNDADLFNIILKEREENIIENINNENGLISEYNKLLAELEKLDIIDKQELNKDEYNELKNVLIKYNNITNFNYLFYKNCWFDSNDYIHLKKPIIEIVKMGSNITLSDIIIDYHFNDISYNVFLDIKQLLNFQISNGVTIPIEHLKIYRDILNIDNLSVEEKLNLHKKLKEENIIEMFYNDYSNSRDIVYQEISESILNSNTIKQFEDKELTERYGINVYKFDGQEFFALARTCEYTSAKKETVGASFSIVGTDHIGPRTKGIIGGPTFIYEGLVPQSIIQIYPGDSYTNPNYKPRKNDNFDNVKLGGHGVYEKGNTSNVRALLKPKDLLGATHGDFNEIQILRNGKNANERYENLGELKPIALYCIDIITPEDIEIAKKENIGIMLIDSKSYQKKTIDYNSSGGLYINNNNYKVNDVRYGWDIQNNIGNREEITKFEDDELNNIINGENQTEIQNEAKERQEDSKKKKKNRDNSYFGGQPHEFDITQEQAIENSQYMDDALENVINETDKGKLQELINDIKNHIEEQYEQVTGQKLNLSEDQVWSILDAHSKNGILGKLTRTQLSKKVRPLIETITDENARRFLIEFGFCGSQKNIGISNETDENAKKFLFESGFYGSQENKEITSETENQVSTEQESQQVTEHLETSNKTKSNVEQLQEKLNMMCVSDVTVENCGLSEEQINQVYDLFGKIKEITLIEKLSKYQLQCIIQYEIGMNDLNHIQNIRNKILEIIDTNTIDINTIQAFKTISEQQIEYLIPLKGNINKVIGEITGIDCYYLSKIPELDIALNNITINKSKIGQLTGNKVLEGSDIYHLSQIKYYFSDDLDNIIRNKRKICKLIGNDELDCSDIYYLSQIKYHLGKTLDNIIRNRRKINKLTGNKELNGSDIYNLSEIEGLGNVLKILIKNKRKIEELTGKENLDCTDIHELSKIENLSDKLDNIINSKNEIEKVICEKLEIKSIRDIEYFSKWNQIFENFSRENWMKIKETTEGDPRIWMKVFLEKDCKKIEFINDTYLKITKESGVDYCIVNKYGHVYLDYIGDMTYIFHTSMKDPTGKVNIHQIAGKQFLQISDLIPEGYKITEPLSLSGDSFPLFLREYQRDFRSDYIVRATGKFIYLNSIGVYTQESKIISLKNIGKNNRIFEAATKEEAEEVADKINKLMKDRGQPLNEGQVTTELGKARVVQSNAGLRRVEIPQIEIVKMHNNGVELAQQLNKCATYNEIENILLANLTTEYHFRDGNLTGEELLNRCNSYRAKRKLQNNSENNPLQYFPVEFIEPAKWTNTEGKATGRKSKIHKLLDS